MGARYIFVTKPIGSALAIISLFFVQRKEFLVNVWKTLTRDIRFVTDKMKFQKLLKYYRRNNYTVIDLFKQQLNQNPDKKIFMCGTSAWTARELEDFSNRVANFFKAEDVKRGETLCLMMEGCPEYVGIWFGLSKIGASTALINTNLTRGPLLHSINLVNGKRIIYGAEMAQAISTVSTSLQNTKYYCFKRVDPGNDYNDAKLYIGIDGQIELNSALQETATTPQPERELKRISATDSLLKIYTSGTTGLPKAAIITFNKAMTIASYPRLRLRLTESDVIYNPLPLYHVAGGLFGITQALCFGNQVIIRPKFSASNFWTDCVKHQCTVALYIGEMCRYLLAAPKKPEETQHNLRLVTGNGLKPQIWKQFVERFKVKQIGEVYASTEGNIFLANDDSKIGAVGYIPWFLRSSSLIQILRVNPETNEPIRNEEGLCVPCECGEPGLLVGIINNQIPGSIFDGYTDRQATEKKVLCDVFRKGQRAFNSGDILVLDKYNYLYFKDRIGDTFRWKGENVSTSEVEAVISGEIKLKDALVYGVEVNNLEGKAGMVAIVDPGRQLDLKLFADKVKKSLPTYSRPLFLRVLGDVNNRTGTYKLKKTSLQLDGFNPAKIKDPLYISDWTTVEYKPLTQQVYDDIKTGKVRL